MEAVREIIAMMRAAAPAGQPNLDGAALQRLRELTRSLSAARAGAAGEHARFLGLRRRELCLPEAELAGWLRGATVLVTGGTGCIGTALMPMLAAREPRRLVNVSRGVTAGGARVPGAEYRTADVRDRQAMAETIACVRPDVIFHVAAQRDPGLAEVEVHRTVATNLLGTRNVLTAAAAAGVPQVVCASTGKALRPYSADVYAASKRAAEWFAATVAQAGQLLCSAARFTHVVDNSIIYRRLLDWAGGGVIRLHSADIAFYAQSARESAQLLLVAGLGSRRGEFRVHAITDLGWPVSLLDLALGVLAETGSSAPVYISGYDPGYEEVPFPGLYDPATAGDVSPLLNAFEAATATASPCPMVDASGLQLAAGPRPAELLSALAETCARTRDARAVRAALDELTWAQLDVTLRAAPGRALDRAAALAHAHGGSLDPQHRRILAAIRETAGPARLTAGPAGCPAASPAGPVAAASPAAVATASPA